MSNKVIVVPQQIQLHLLAGSEGHRIVGTPPWVDQEKLKQWGDSVEGILRKHDGLACGIHLFFAPDGKILAHYCGDRGVTREINAEIGAFVDVITEALLVDPEIVGQYEQPDISISVVIFG